MPEFRVRSWRLLVGLGILAVVVCGIATVAKFYIWAPIDERPHYAYIQGLVEHHRLPRINDPVSWQVQAITDNTWPARSPRDPASVGLAGRSYEAFQSPLYYLTAAPAFAVVSDHRDKVFAVRTFDLCLVLITVLLLVRLAREILPLAPLAGAAAAIGIVLWPGVLVRGVTMSNEPLDMVVTAALFLTLLTADRRRDRRLLVVSGVLLGICLLTQLTLIYMAVPFVIVLARMWRRAPIASAVAAVAPVVLLAPWLISNLIRLGTLTAYSAAKRQQTPVLYPNGNHFGLGDVPNRLWNMPRGILPQEWFSQINVWWVRVAVLIIAVGFLLAVIAAVLKANTLSFWLPASALLTGIALMLASAAVAHWDIFLLRYLYPVLPVLAISTAAIAYRTIGPRYTALAVSLGLVLVAALWVDMAGRFYFTNVVHSLGISRSSGLTMVTDRSLTSATFTSTGARPSITACPGHQPVADDRAPFQRESLGGRRIAQSRRCGYGQAGTALTAGQ